MLIVASSSLTQTMSSLESLPPELLILVLQKVGADGFRARVDRLIVSGCWYKCAQEVHLSDIKLSAKALNKFPPKSDKICGLLRRYMMQLRICLAGFLESVERLFPGNGLPKSLLDEIRQRLELEVWLNSRLRDVSTFLTRCKNLRNSILKAPQDHLMGNGSCRRYRTVYMKALS